MPEPVRIWLYDLDASEARRAEALDLARAGRRAALVALAAATLGGALALWGPLGGLARWLMLLALAVSLVAAGRAWATIIRTCHMLGDDR